MVFLDPLFRRPPVDVKGLLALTEREPVVRPVRGYTTSTDWGVVTGCARCWRGSDCFKVDIAGKNGKLLAVTSSLA